MSVGPWAESEASEPETVVPAPLHLVPGHEHDWRLRSVDYDDGLEVRRYECASCEDVLFR